VIRRGLLAEPLRSACIARSVVDDEAERAAGLGRHHLTNLHDLIPRSPTWLELACHPVAVGMAASALGWNIALHHTQLVVAPPAPAGAGRGGYGWHQDNNRMNVDIDAPAPHPMISLKLGWFLSDATEDAMANLCVVPGSQVRARPSVPIGGQPDGAIELYGSIGDVVMFDRRIWHAASVNGSETVRRMAFMGYSHRWLRPKSAIDPSLAPEGDPVVAQLLGASPSGANGRYEPSEADVPLRALLLEAGLDVP